MLESKKDFRATEANIISTSTASNCKAAIKHIYNTLTSTENPTNEVNKGGSAEEELSVLQEVTPETLVYM